MSRLEIASPKKAKIVMEGLYKDLERRMTTSMLFIATFILRSRVRSVLASPSPCVVARVP